jgi:hypothetical protein
MRTRSSGAALEPIPNPVKPPRKKKEVQAPEAPKGPAGPEDPEVALADPPGYIYDAEPRLPEIYTVIVYVIIALMVLTILMGVSTLVAMTARCVKYATILATLAGLAWVAYERNKEQLYPRCTYMWEIITDSERGVKNFIVLMCVLNTAYSVAYGSSVGTFVSVVHLFVVFAYSHTAINDNSRCTVVALAIFWFITTGSYIFGPLNNGRYIAALVGSSRADARDHSLGSMCDFQWRNKTLEMRNIDVSLEGVSAILKCASKYRAKISVRKFPHTTRTVSYEAVLVATKILSLENIFLPVFNFFYSRFRYVFSYEMSYYAAFAAAAGTVVSILIPGYSAYVTNWRNIAANVVFNIFKYIFERIWADYQNNKFSPKFVNIIYYVGFFTVLALVVSIYTHNAEVETYIEYLDFAEITCMLTSAYLLKNVRVADRFKYTDILINKDYLVNKLEFRMLCITIIHFFFPLSYTWMYLCIKYNDIFDEDLPVVVGVAEVVEIAEPIHNPPPNYLGIFPGQPNAVAANNPNAGM